MKMHLCEMKERINERIALFVSARRWFVLCILIRFVVVSCASLVEHEYILTALGTYVSMYMLTGSSSANKQQHDS
uniref:Uncharacterized protein n=1 Tax=Glossina palpalis gambiensis TaxID=67801 RepID=A0A1B0BFQ3_9MUSC